MSEKGGWERAIAEQALGTAEAIGKLVLRVRMLEAEDEALDAKIQVVLHAGGGSFKSQMKKADRSQARFALILGDDEVTNNQVTLKPMQAATKGEQLQCSIEEAIGYLTANKK